MAKYQKPFCNLACGYLNMTEDTFLFHKELHVFTLDIPPVAIDIMLKVKGLEFEECYRMCVIFEDEDTNIRTIDKERLLKSKKAANRAKDVNDLENLQ